MSIPPGAIGRLTRIPSVKQFRPRDVARVVCATLENGFTAEEICAELADGCGWDCEDDPDCRRKKEEISKIAVQALQGNQQVLVTADLILQGLAITFRGLLLLAGVLPALRPAVIPLRLASVQLTNFRVTVAARRAANDAIRDAVLKLAA